MSELCGVLRRKPDRDGSTDRIGTPCRHQAGWGTDHLGAGPCKLHGGNLPVVQKKAQFVLATMELRKELKAFGTPLPDVNPEQALLQMVREAAGNVAYLGARVSELSEREAQEVGSTRGAPPVWDPLKGAGLFGPKIGIDKDGGEHVVGEEYRAVVTLYGEWSDRLVKYSKTALDAGIAKAQVEIAKSQGATIVVIINRVLAQVGLDEAKQLIARQLIAEEFRAQAAEPARLGDGS